MDEEVMSCNLDIFKWLTKRQVDEMAQHLNVENLHRMAQSNRTYKLIFKFENFCQFV